MDLPPQPEKIAVALGSSFLGVYAHAGFLTGLEEAGIEPHRIAGSSAGALAGAFFASGLRGEVLKKAALAPGLRWSFADPGALWRLPGVLTSFWSSGVFSGKRAVAYLKRELPQRDLEALEMLEISVTDARTKRTVIRRDGPLAELVIASCAVPVLFAIQDVENERYLDGGIACEAPFEQWLDDPEIGAILIHRVGHEQGSGPTVKWETMANSVGIAHQTVCGELHRHRVELAKLKGKRLIEIDTTTPFPGLFSQKLAPLCYQRGYESGKAVRLTAGD
jgi:predicted acylesterase/phospholipase RssA